MKIFPKEWSTLWSDIITLALSAAGLIMGEEPLLSVIGAAVKGTDYLNISPGGAIIRVNPIPIIFHNFGEENTNTESWLQNMTFFHFEMLR